LEAYAKAHRLGIDSENHAREIKFLAAKRMGELVPAETGGRGKKKDAEVRQVSHQRLSEFRKFAKVPEPEFRERINDLKQREEKITYSRILLGEWYQRSDSIEW
jgi:molybdenum-dependent DNA-binding transcriptional regulator ModE